VGVRSRISVTVNGNCMPAGVTTHSGPPGCSNSARVNVNGSIIISVNIMERRTFVMGAAATLALPLWGCGGGIELPPMSDQRAPTAVSREGLQFQTQPLKHALSITHTTGTTKGTTTVAGGLGRGSGQLNFPVDVAVLDGRAYVAETGNHRVQIFDAQGASQGLLGEGVLSYPGGIIAGSGEVLVSDSRNARLVGFSPGGQVTRIMGSGLLSAPRGMAIVPDGLLVADPGLRRVLKLAPDGTVLAEFGRGWILPWDVATDGKSIFVADVARPGIAVVGLNGERIDEIVLGTAPTYLSFRDGTLYYN
jgi:DNA-binding beta-propeller fold protein YncE